MGRETGMKKEQHHSGRTTERVNRAKMLVAECITNGKIWIAVVDIDDAHGSIHKVKKKKKERIEQEKQDRKKKRRKGREQDKKVKKKKGMNQRRTG